MTKISHTYALCQLTDDFIYGRWERLNRIRVLPTHEYNFDDSSRKIIDILVALSPCELLKPDWAPPLIITSSAYVEISFRYCATLLLNALSDLSCGQLSRAESHVKLFCISFGDFLELNSDFSFASTSFRRLEACSVLTHCLRKFRISQTLSSQGLLPRKMTVVLGMHRSGTSALSGMLAQAGLCGPKDSLGSTYSNMLGYWESEALVTSSDLFISSNQSHWSQLYRWAPDWWISSSALNWVESYLDDLINTYECCDHIVLKDPRLCFLLEAMTPCLLNPLIEVDFLLILRSPVEVISSLCKAEEIYPRDALNLWIGSVLQSEYLSRFYPRRIFTYLNLIEAPGSVLNSCCSLWGMNPSEFNDDKAKEFIQSDLYRQKDFTLRSEFKSMHPDLESLLLLAEEIYIYIQDPNRNFSSCSNFFERRWLECMAAS
jgi:hypothetical protein